MKIGIIGLPQSGKKTVFTLLTSHTPSEKELGSGKPILSYAVIKDPRFDFLVDLYKPKKVTRAKIDVEVLPKLEKDTIRQGAIFTDIANTDALCYVVRAFDNESVYHIDGSVDAERDIANVNGELILHDLVFIEKRLDRLERDIRKLNDKDMVKEREILLKLKDHLEEEKPLRTLTIAPEEEKVISGYPFITRKEFIVVLNVSEGALTDTALLDKVKNALKPEGVHVVQISAQVESEIASLETDAERIEFLNDLRIAEPAIDLLTRVCLEVLDRLSFFTCGPDEVHQWTVRTGATAPQAAGAIHSDLERGFIRAEVFKFADLKELGGEDKVKQAGKLLIKGKDYRIEDGDIVFIRFNV